MSALEGGLVLGDLDRQHEVRLGTWAELKDLAFPLRMEVFVREQQVPAELEHDDEDARATHALVVSPDGVAVATGRLLANGRIGRLAVARKNRGAGLGKAVLTKLVAHAKAGGVDNLWLHAQCDAQAFYERLGFVVDGEPFIEAGISHVLMVHTNRSPNQRK